MTKQKTTHSKPVARGGARGGRNPVNNSDSWRIQLFGLHAVEAALANVKRPVYAIQATENAAHRLGPLIARRGLEPERVLPKTLDRQLGADTVHQGVLLKVGPLESLTLEELDLSGTLLVLDQVTDPHNVGAEIGRAHV